MIKCCQYSVALPLPFYVEKVFCFCFSFFFFLKSVLVVAKSSGPDFIYVICHKSEHFYSKKNSIPSDMPFLVLSGKSKAKA